jgi:hypothetical protein
MQSAKIQNLRNERLNVNPIVIHDSSLGYRVMADPATIGMIIGVVTDIVSLIIGRPREHGGARTNSSGRLPSVNGEAR